MLTPTLPAGCRSIAHDVAVSTICGPPQRVVALGPHMLDMVLALGVQPVGFGGMADQGLDTFTKPLIQIPYQGQYITATVTDVGARRVPDFASLEALKPDLILGEDHPKLATQYDQLNAIAPTLLFSGDANREWQNTIGPIADALGQQDRVPTVLQA